MVLFSRGKRIVDDDGNYSQGRVDIIGNKIGEWKFYKKNDILYKSQVFDTRNDKNPSKHYYDNGNVYIEGFLVSRERTKYSQQRLYILDGEVKLYYKSGELHTIFHTKVVYNQDLDMCDYHSFTDGPLTSYYKTGEVLRTCNMKLGQVVGPFIVYNKDGTTKFEEIYEEQYDPLYLDPHFQGIEGIMEISK